MLKLIKIICILSRPLYLYAILFQDHAKIRVNKEKYHK